eukprot:6214078-Pleurochrysis_carterae.AAC.4
MNVTACHARRVDDVVPHSSRRSRAARVLLRCPRKCHDGWSLGPNATVPLHARLRHKDVWGAAGACDRTRCKA